MTKKILAIDGGGIRGIVPILLLIEIEARLKQKGQSLYNIFDLYAGTSTGGIIALGLAKQNHLQLVELLDMYEGEEAHIIFKKDFLSHFLPDNLRVWKDERYSADGINTILKSKFGETEKLGDLKQNVLITAYDMSKSKATFFTHFVKDKDSEYKDIPIWNIARATSAAPTYFEPHCFTTRYHGRNIEYNCVDGGMLANNPAMCAYIEAKKQWPNEEILMVSIGTGSLKQNIPFEDVKDLNRICWLPKIFSVFFDGMNDTVDYQLDKILSKNHKYFRFQIDLTEKCSDQLDNTNYKNIKYLENLVSDHISDPNKWGNDLDNLISKL